MSADNIVVIKNEDDGKLRGYHRSMSAYCEGQYDYEGECMFCGGTGLDRKTINGDGRCHACDNGHYTPPKEDSIFEADTIEGAIDAYDKWLKQMQGGDEFGLFHVEYGYSFEGLVPNEETVKVLEESEFKGDCAGLHEVDSVEELFKELYTDENEDVELKLLKEAINNHFCTERGHQKRFLDPGKHGRHIDDPATPGGAGCIYCNMIRLEMENEELRNEILKLKKG